MRLSEIARRIGAEFIGPDDPPVASVGPRRGASKDTLTLILRQRELEDLVPGAVAGVILPEHLDLSACRVPAVVAQVPKAAYARAASLLETTLPDAGRQRSFAPVCEGQDAVLGEACRFGPNVFLGAGVRIGDYVSIGANAVLATGTSVGNRCSIGPGTAIGHPPFDFARDGGAWLQLPGACPVEIADDVYIGAHCTIARGCARPTSLAADVKIDDGVHVGHDTRIGVGTLVAGGASFAGYVTIGAQCKIGGRVAVAEGVSIADGVTVTAMTGVSRSIDEPGQRVSAAWPAMHSREWWRFVARLRRLTGAQND